MRKILPVIFFQFLFLFFLSSNAFADTNFLVTNDLSYDISENGNTKVTFHLSLTNATSQLYARTYKIQVGLKDISNVSSYDANGPIVPKLIKNDIGYTLEAPLNTRTVGVGNTLPFTISFTTSDITRSSGKNWEINIPSVKNNEFSDFTISVKIPKSFGKPIFVKPIISSYDPLRNVLSFTKQQVGTGGISIGFSENQIYAFKLTYHLKNSNIFPAKTEIAIPPTTNYQDLTVDEMNPKPLQVRLDEDGNWMAQYSLYPTEKKDVVVKGKARLHLYPKKENLSENNRQHYLKELPYWQAGNTDIVQKAKELKTPQAIYGFVVKTLRYDFSRVESNKPRLGTEALLKDTTSAICLEFTDLFITLARAAGIPAREVDGFAYTKNSTNRPLGLVKDILHAWPEYYDSEQKTWVMVDPTWENTTGVDYFSVLDTDHFAFDLRGSSSLYPVPAGGYKQRLGKSEKDVEVSPLPEEEISPSEQLELENSIPPKIFSGSSFSTTLSMRNKGNALSSAYTITVTSEFLTPHTQTITFDTIPPFGSSQKTLIFDRPAFLTNTTDTITIKLGEKSYISRVYISPLALNTHQIIIGGIVSAGIFGIFIWIRSFKTRRISIFR